MNRITSNQKGSLSLAIVVAIIAVLSSIAMAVMSNMDTATYSLQYDALQELHLLRSELDRGLYVKRSVNYAGTLAFPERRVQLNSKNMRRSYYMKTKLVPKAEYNAGDNSVASGSVVQSLVRGKRGSLSGFITSKNESSIQKYGEWDLEQMSFAGYHYFTDNELSTNDTDVRFWGNDVIYGRIHSNSSITIQNGGNNQYNGSWPCFFGHVSTSGTINWHNGAGPMDQIFRDGYEEEAGELVFNPSADEIRAFGTTIDVSGDILYINSLGASTEGYMGTITYGGIDSLINLVPDPDVWTDSEGTDWPYSLVKDRTAVNLMTHKDTIWSALSVTCPNGGSVMIDGAQLWLEGTFTGAQTWACSDTLFLAGSILLGGTGQGESPDDPLHMNRTDYVGIVSEESIVIKYGMPDLTAGPVDGVYPRRHPNSNDIYIYAALCALGEDEENPNYDGVFTFEYMHPHLSTHPSVIYAQLGGLPTIYDPELDTVFTDVHIPYPDLVGMSFIPALGYQPTDYGQIIPFGPTTGQNNWPGNLDYPFYNPLYPELNGTTNSMAGERGAIYLFGSVAQRRRGYVHRSNYDNANRAQNVWAFNDPENVGVTQYGGNCPTSGEGYDKEYMFDTRFEQVQPPHYPSVHVERGLSPYDAESARFKRPPSSF